MIAILGAGAMGVALATHLTRAGHDTVVLATEHDQEIVRAWRDRLPHPALGVVIHPDITMCPPAQWGHALIGAETVAVAIASQGLHPVLRTAARYAPAGVDWVLATKGWQAQTLQSPSEVARAVLGDSASVVSLAGPGIAAEIVAGSPTALLCASPDSGARRRVARVLSSPSMLLTTTSDVAGAETASAYKNVAAIAVGIAEGLSERFMESAFVRGFANARAAMFAQGMMDMVCLAEARGGHATTVLGLAGAGDLYVTCVGGRNGRFGQLLGAGATLEQGLRSIGSTVEGVANTAVALELAERHCLDLPTARVVDLALRQQLLDDHSMEQVRHLFATTMRAPTPAEDKIPAFAGR